MVEFDNIIIYFSINSLVKLFDPCIYFLLDLTYFELIKKGNSNRMKWRVHNIEVLLSDNVCDMPALFKGGLLSDNVCDMLAQLSFEPCNYFLLDLT